MKFKIAIIAAATAMVVTIPSTQAQQQPPPRSALLEQLAACRTISNDADRLACYDQRALALEAAERSGEVVVVDRTQIRQARRQLFGFELSAIPDIFSDKHADESIDAIESLLITAVQGGDGKWVFKLADESEWRQTDAGSVSFRNRRDTQIRVRRAALGSYLLVAGNSRAVRVRRQ